MEYRLKRQVSIATIFFIVLLLVLFFIFSKEKEVPSCFDGALNQDEEQIDCGGAFCVSCLEFYFEDTQILSSDFLLFEESYDVIARVKNTNSQHGTDDLVYNFKFYDKYNNFLKEEKGKSYILAGETKYIAKSNLEVEGEPAFVKFEVEPVTWKEQRRTSIKLPIFSKKYESIITSGAPGTSQATGVVENQTNYSFVDVDLVAILFNDKDEKIAINHSRINNLRSGERRALIIPWFSELENGPVNKVIIEAYADAIDDSNILK